MEKTKEEKTGTFVNRVLKETYQRAKYSDKKMFILRIISKHRENGKFKYYFEVNKSGIPIYKRGLETEKINVVHTWIREILLKYMSLESFHYCTLNNNYKESKLNIYFKNNFGIEVTYDEIEKDFFEDLFINNKEYILEYIREKDSIKKSKSYKPKITNNN